MIAFAAELRQAVALWLQENHPELT